MTFSKIMLTVLGGAALGAVIGTLITSEKGEQLIESLGKSLTTWANDNVKGILNTQKLPSQNLANENESITQEHTLGNYNL